MDTKKITKILEKTKNASRELANISTETKNKILETIARNLILYKEKILKENQKDINNAKKMKLSSALIDRLTLTDKKIEEMASSLKEIINLPDPVGTIISEWTRPSGIKIQKVRVPLGVICMIYESRPNVTVDSTALCIKSGNAVILRGGSEAINSNRILVKVIKESLRETGTSSDLVQFIDSPDRKIIYKLIKFDNLIDLVIPRGGEEMVRSIREHSTIPVLSHGKGLCHTYIDKDANIEMAINVSYNAKVQRPGVCNAMETLLVHKDIAKKVLPKLAELYTKAGVELRGCKKTKKILFTGLSSERFFEKGLIFHIPMIEIKELKNYKDLDDYIKKLILQKNVDWIIFTSRYAVYYFFERLYNLGYDTRILFGIKIAAIGSSTANRLKEYGVVCDLVPKRECSLGLIDEFKKILKSSKQKVKIFLPRSDIADKGLTEMLKKLGAEVYPSVVYKNVIPENLPEIDFSFFDEIIFSSPSCVKNFVKKYGVPPEKLKLKSIGKVTEKAVEMFIKKNKKLR
ncbi:MAG: glutamate-5-semialdehyde dehydrogenase [Endomicrobiia bacterium]